LPPATDTATWTGPQRVSATSPSTALAVVPDEPESVEPESVEPESAEPVPSSDGVDCSSGAAWLAGALAEEITAEPVPTPSPVEVL